jgi:hypothetical protein
VTENSGEIIETAGSEAATGQTPSTLREPKGAEFDGYQLTLTFGGEVASLGDLWFLLAWLDELHGVLASAAAWRLGADSLVSVPSPALTRVVKQSPLTVELAATATGTALSVAALRMLGAALREPERVGEFFPRIKAGWFDGRSAAYQARLHLEALRSAGGSALVEAFGTEAIRDRESLGVLRGARVLNAADDQAPGLAALLRKVSPQSENYVLEILDSEDPDLTRRVREIRRKGTERLDMDARGFDALFRGLSRSAERMVLETLESDDQVLAQQVRDRMLCFDDIEQLDDSAVQSLIGNLDERTLTLALKGASGGLCDKIMSNLPRAVAEDLATTIEQIGPVFLSEVENAQGEMVKELRLMETRGQIILSKSIRWNRGEALID